MAVENSHQIAGDVVVKNISIFDSCYGCGVCAVACSTNAISMIQNQDGFVIPVVDDKKCTGCQKCLKVCAFNDKALLDVSLFVHGYAAYSNNDDIRKSCSSGGIGYEFAKCALLEGYKICAVRYDVENRRAEHYMASTAEELSQSRGSKYLQSHTEDAFSNFMRIEKYLVVGTPCQIDSLRRYVRLKKMEQNYIFVDFFCHGVPSDLMWKKYVQEYGIANPTEIKWRDKRTGWHDSYNMIFKSNDKEKTSRMSRGDMFYKFFLRNRCLGKACYDDCKYKMTNSAADIRIGDLWGAKYLHDEKGVSGILTFTPIGEKILHLLESCTVIPENTEVITESQMKKCPKRPASYRYVKKKLKTDMRLRDIDRHASKVEFFLDDIPHNFKYYSHRLIDVMLCR